MGVNKNIDNLKKELDDMHRIFDNIIGKDKNEKSDDVTKDKIISKDDNSIKVTESPKTTNTSNIKINDKDELENPNSIYTIKNDIEEIEITNTTIENQPIESHIEVTDSIDDNELINKQLVEIENTNNDKINTEKEDTISDITISFESSSNLNNNSDNDAKIINLNKQEQYLSIREKLEKIKNEIKEKELELRKKNKN